MLSVAFAVQGRLQSLLWEFMEDGLSRLCYGDGGSLGTEMPGAQGVLWGPGQECWEELGTRVDLSLLHSVCMSPDVSGTCKT